jgi:hypothetical protein
MKGKSVWPLSLPAALTSLTRDDFTLLKGLCEAVHFLLCKQQVEVVLKKKAELNQWSPDQ